MNSLTTSLLFLDILQKNIDIFAHVSLDFFQVQLLDFSYLPGSHFKKVFLNFFSELTPKYFQMLAK